MSETRVLLVDDEEDFVDILGERLRNRGFEVETVGDGPSAVAAVERRAFEAILLDMAMPGMDGVTTLSALLEINPDQQVILLTGHSTLTQAAEAMKLGARDLLEKPTDIEVIVNTIESAAARTLELLQERADETSQDILKHKGW